MAGDTLADLMAEMGIDNRSAALRLGDQGYRPQRPRPRVMRPVEERRFDPNPGVRAQADRQAYDATQRSMAPIRGERAPPSNQFAEAGGMALEMTGLPSVRRSASAFTRGDLREGATEGAMGVLGLAGLATLSPRGAMRPAPRPMPQRAPVAASQPPRPMPRALDAGSGGVRPMPSEFTDSLHPDDFPMPFGARHFGGDDMLNADAELRATGNDSATKPWPPRRSPVREVTPPRAPDGGNAVARPERASTPMDRLLHSPAQRHLYAEDNATVRQTTMGDQPVTMYDFDRSPAQTNVRFHPMPDGETYAIAMSARGVSAESPMSVKAQAFADAMSAIEHHARRTNARRTGARYLFTGETDAHTRLFRGLAERAEWPNGAVIHDTPAGFEVSFAPERPPYSGRLPYADFAHNPEGRPNLGQQGQFRLSDVINSRARQIAEARRGALPAPEAPAVGPRP